MAEAETTETSSTIVFFAWFLHNFAWAAIKRAVIEHLEDGSSIIFMHCDGILAPCHINRLGDKKICKECRFAKRNQFRQLKRIYGEKIKFVSVEEMSASSKNELNKADQLVRACSSPEDLKAIEINGCIIGWGVLSSYISFTRNLDPDVRTKEVSEYLAALTRTSIRLAIATESLVVSVSPVKVLLFNGRFADARPVLEVTKKLGISFDTIEFRYVHRSEGKACVLVRTKDRLPHDFASTARRIRLAWDESSLSDEKKRRLGSEFFFNRRDGCVIGDRKSYIKNQKKSLPSCFNFDRHNVALYISSEDEFAALGPEFNSESLFSSQLEGAKWLCGMAAKHDFDLYIRVHPNLHGVGFAYHLAYKDLGVGRQNVFIIDAGSSISTYQLMEASDLVVSFVSSVGVEATFWGKSSIVLCGTSYERLGAAHKPYSLDELEDMLQRNPPTSDKLAAQKYGFYFFAKRESDLEIPSPIIYQSFGVFRVSLFRNFELFGSKFLYRCALLLKRYLLSLSFWNTRMFKRVPAIESARGRE